MGWARRTTAKIGPVPGVTARKQPLAFGPGSGLVTHTKLGRIAGKAECNPFCSPVHTFKGLGEERLLIPKMISKKILFLSCRDFISAVSNEVAVSITVPLYI